MNLQPDRRMESFVIGESIEKDKYMKLTYFYYVRTKKEQKDRNKNMHIKIFFSRLKKKKITFSFKIKQINNFIFLVLWFGIDIF